MRDEQVAADPRDGALGTPDASVLEFIERRQRTRYGDAAKVLRLDGGADAAWRRLAGASRADVPGYESVRSLPGFRELTAGEGAWFDGAVDASVRRERLTLPTRFEHRAHYVPLTRSAKTLMLLLETTDERVEPAAVVATQPTQQVNASTDHAPGTRTPVMFFELGLCELLTDLARLIGWAVPALGPRELFDDDRIPELARSYTMPLEASEAMSAALYAYVLRGTPVLSDHARVPIPSHNLYLTVAVHELMLNFVVGHELAHAALGHLRRSLPPADPWHDEYDADEFGALVTTLELSGRTDAVAAALWAADLALGGMQLIHDELAFMAFSGPVRWNDRQHPDERSRRAQLRARIADRRGRGYPDASIESYRVLLGMTDVLIGRLADIARIPIAAARARGDQPSPLWRTHIDAVFAPAS